MASAKALRGLEGRALKSARPDATRRESDGRLGRESLLVKKSQYSTGCSDTTRAFHLECRRLPTSSRIFEALSTDVEARDGETTVPAYFVCTMTIHGPDT